MSRLSFNPFTGTLDFDPISSGGAAWGGITGTLSSQTDLQNALDAKVAGPAVAVANRIATFNGVTGKIIQDGGVTLATIAGLVPIGGTISWLKSLTGTPALPSAFVECNGQTISDAASPYNGVTIPNLNGSGSFGPYLRGYSASGFSGGAEIPGLYGGPFQPGSGGGLYGVATHGDTGIDNGIYTNATFIPPCTGLFYEINIGQTQGSPPYYTTVIVMRIK